MPEQRGQKKPVVIDARLPLSLVSGQIFVAIGKAGSRHAVETRETGRVVSSLESRHGLGAAALMGAAPEAMAVVLLIVPVGFPWWAKAVKVTEIVSNAEDGPVHAPV